MRNRYKKGADFERQLVLDFWRSGWAAVRAAGSGGGAYPIPDVIAVKGGAVIAVECKTTVKDRLSVGEAIRGLEAFHGTAGGEAYLALKFPREKPRFYRLRDLAGRGNKTVTLDECYMTFEMITGEQAVL